MNESAIKDFISIREKQKSVLEDLRLQLELMHEESNFTDRTWKEIQAKISSRLEFLERSIQSHNKLLKSK